MLTDRIAIPPARADRVLLLAVALLASLLATLGFGAPLAAQTIPDGALVIPLKPGNQFQRIRDGVIYDGTRLELLFDPSSNGDVYVLVRDLVRLTDMPREVPQAALEIQINNRAAVRVGLVAVGWSESSRNPQNATVIEVYRGELPDEEASALLAASRIRGRVRGISFESDPKVDTPLLGNAKRRTGADVVAVANGTGRAPWPVGGVPQTVGATSSASSGATGSLHGANIRIVRDFTFEAPDSVSDKFTEVEERVSFAVAGPPCGTARLCASRWDLRPVAINLPGTILPSGGVVPITITVENRGATASQLSELQVCFQSNNASAGCSRRIANVSLPPIPSAANVRVSATARLLPDESSNFYIAAIVDPDQVTNEENRDNNFLASDALAAERPALQWLQVEAVVLGEERKAVELTLRVRNKSVAATSAPAEVSVMTHEYCGTDGTSPYRFQVPALGPRQIVNVQLIVSHPTRAVCGNAPTMWLQVDPDQKLLWGRSHERAFTLQYEAIRR